MVDISPKKSLSRAYLRAYSNGRVVPYDFILFDADDNPAKNYLKLFEDGILEPKEWSAFDNEHREPTDPAKPLSPAQLRGAVSARELSDALRGRRFLGTFGEDRGRDVAAGIRKVFPLSLLGLADSLYFNPSSGPLSQAALPSTLRESVDDGIGHRAFRVRIQGREFALQEFSDDIAPFVEVLQSEAMQGILARHGATAEGTARSMLQAVSNDISRFDGPSGPRNARILESLARNSRSPADAAARLRRK